MEIIDVSVPIRVGMAHYPGDPGVHMELARSRQAGHVADVTRLDFGVHSGTHVDAPSHFLDGGAAVDALPLGALLGPADVVDATALAASPIGESSLAALAVADDCERLLLKTRNSELWAREGFAHDFLSLDESGARWIVARGIALVGLDYLSIGDPDAHRALLGNGVVVLEGLDLRGVDPGRYELVCLPAKIEGADGAPARTVLVRR